MKQLARDLVSLSIFLLTVLISIEKADCLTKKQKKIILENKYTQAALKLIKDQFKRKVQSEKKEENIDASDYVYCSTD